MIDVKVNIDGKGMDILVTDYTVTWGNYGEADEVSIKGIVRPASLRADVTTIEIRSV